MDADRALRQSPGRHRRIDDPTGDYMFSLGKRVDELERAVEHLEKQLDSCAGGSAIQQ
jgi:hypothetical protein